MNEPAVPILGQTRQIAIHRIVTLAGVEMGLVPSGEGPNPYMLQLINVMLGEVHRIPCSAANIRALLTNLEALEAARRNGGSDGVE